MPSSSRRRSTIMAIYHVPDVPSVLTQRCRECGKVLVDFRPAEGGLTRITEADPFFLRESAPVIETAGGLQTLEGSTDDATACTA